MSKKIFIACAIAALAFAQGAKAQTNLQMFYDLGRGYATTTVEGFYGDNWGDTFFFIDHYYATSADRENLGAGTAFSLSITFPQRSVMFSTVRLYMRFCSNDIPNISTSKLGLLASIPA